MKTLDIGLDRNRIDGNYPKPGTKNYTRANYSDDVVLSIDRDILTATVVGRLTEIPKPNNKHQVRGGYILGVDRGQWGGCVIFVPEQEIDNLPCDLCNGPSIKWLIQLEMLKNEELHILTYNNFKGFAEYGCRKFVFTGLANMGTDEGCFYELILQENTWVLREIQKLDSCPQVFTQTGSKIYLVTSDCLVELNLEEDKPKTKILFEGVDWGGLYPNSMIYANNSLYVGMRGFVYEYDLNSGNATWYNYLSYDKESVKELEDKE